ncbi:MAG: hypothetical protein GY788_12200 [bacterium]|nr:hypothetical protein [bacterium]MCP4305617.1 hypothetical protein [bacterium]
MLRTIVVAAGMTLATAVSAATLTQTAHFPEADAGQLFALYMSADGQQKITGFPARYTDDAGDPVEAAGVGDRLAGFCFTEEQCGLDARIVDVQEAPGVHTVVMSWWNFGWVSAVDPADASAGPRGAPDSTLILTFRDVPTGAQIELVQVNVPDYKVVIPSPDGSEEVGPLSRIVNTHWNTLYWDKMRALEMN